MRDVAAAAAADDDDSVVRKNCNGSLPLLTSKISFFFFSFVFFGNIVLSILHSNKRSTEVVKNCIILKFNY